MLRVWIPRQRTATTQGEQDFLELVTTANLATADRLYIRDTIWEGKKISVASQHTSGHHTPRKCYL
jgi:hypothetical protein